ncbi:cilia- and flagella-associated protein 45-like [Haematobia irritans]|uniref:cilia- and flagella-associated protein 45-like n=1 Tax=Haematobia irritans TaxID=7368 RepID=UPI003F4F69EC
MPCFSACQRRSAQPFSQANLGRAKTAFRHNGSDIKLENFACKKDLKSNQCHDIFSTQGITQRASKTNRYKGERKVSIPPKELERLKTASKVVSLEDRLDALMKREEEVKRLEQETEQTKQRFRKIDEARKKLEEESNKNSVAEDGNDKLRILERAFLAKHEQEEEVKKANRIILEAKCHAVRDAQVQEKSLIHKELKSDEERLERNVIENAKKALTEEDEKFLKLHENKKKYANEIKKQLHEREAQRFLEAERIEEEALILRKANAAIKKDEERRQKESHERRQKYRQDLAKVVEMSTQFRKILCQQEQEAEMKVAAYMKEKADRLRDLHNEKMLAKQEFERKQQRIYSLAEKILKSKSEREEMSYIREQERIEREYRRKEREAVIRKKQIERDLAEARKYQMQESKHRQALQIARAEQDFNTLIDRLKQEEAKDRKAQQERERKREKYRLDIINQMGDNEMQRRRLKELEKSQVVAWQASERQRDANIRAVINAKLNAMRDACLPEKYIKDVEKQLSGIIGSNKNALPKL